MQHSKMRKLFMCVVVLIGLCNCHSNADKKVKAVDQPQADSFVSVNDFDSPDETPTQSEERERIIADYGITQHLDTTINIQGQNLRLFLRYYCLLDSVIIVPKSYEDNGIEFQTHPYASDLILMNGIDTLLNMHLKASDFSAYFDDVFGGNLKKFGSIKMPSLYSERLKSGELIVHYPLWIPATDIGKGMGLALNKEGKYRIIDPDSTLAQN